MSAKRMSREQFFGKLAASDEAGLQKALWNLYWRGSAAMRERIEAEIDPGVRESRKRRSKEPADPKGVLDEVRIFVELARSGAYIAGDRRVSPRERTRWRFTFQRLVKDACDALRAEGVEAAALAVEQLVDLACETASYEYFRSEDPVEAAKVVVSDVVALLWGTLRDRYGPAEFARRAAPQLIRWESRYGWTRSGYDRISEKETSLASVIAGMLPALDAWIDFADRYLDALDHVARDNAVRPRRVMWSSIDHGDYDRKRRTEALAEWHQLLFRKLVDSEAEDRLVRVSRHPALGGPELGLLRARLAHHRGGLDDARSEVHKGLEELPGHRDLLDFATEIGACLPANAQQVVVERSRTPIQ